MTNVWVVSVGTMHEGGSVEAVFAYEPTEEECVSLVRASFGPWREFEVGGHQRQWRSGCDYLSLKRHEVRESAVEEMKAAGS